QSVVCPVLIGRDAPLTTAYHTLERARAGHGSTLLVSGEAGIGKSRMVRAMAERAGALGFVSLEGACFEADSAHPYGPLLDMVRVVSATASPALAAHYFAPAASELVTLFPELRALFPEAPSRPALDPDEERRRLFHAFVESAYALARVQPLLLVVEDVHWSDDATLDLVLHLARRIATHPVALVLTFRSDEVGPRLASLLADFDRARCASEVALRPLEAPQVSEMLQAIFGEQVALAGPFVDRLHALTEGNPFFVEELLKALLHAGDLVSADGTWRARALEAVRVPRTASEAVGRRLAGLSDAARRVASVAAVAGRRFDFDLLRTLTGHEEAALLALVKELVEAQLVVEESADRFAFRHALTRETMRTQLLARERVALHRAIAAALEAQDATGSHEVEGALAYHTFEAGEWESARRYALRAAEHALTIRAPREALQQFQRAVTATTNAGQRPDGALLLARGGAHETLGAFGPASEDFSAALAMARASGDLRGQWQALHALGLLWAARDYERAGEFRRAALDVARHIGHAPLIARSLNRVGNWHVNREHPHAGIPFHDEALSIFEGGEDRNGVAETVDLLAMAHHIAGSQEIATQLYERSVEHFSALEQRRGLANALAVLAVCGPSYHASAGPVATSTHEHLILAEERAVRLAGDIEWRAGEAFSRYLVADCVGWRGKLARALRLARESLAIAEEIEHREWQCGARRVLGAIALDLFATSEAVDQLQRSHAIARKLSSATWTRWTGAPLAIALARAGDVEHATRVLDEIDALVPTSGTKEGSPDAGPPTLGLRYLALARGETALAAGDAARALAAIAELGEEGVPRVALLRARALLALNRGAEATGSLGAARQGAEQQGARHLLWRIDALQGAIHLGQRQRLEARRAFDAARAAAESLVAGLDEPGLLAGFGAGLDAWAPPPPAPTKARAAKSAFGGLTRRERDTAALIAQGKSNRAIARQLGIGERTVEGYVAAAFTKLGFSSRAQIAVWATDHGLAASPPKSGPSRT
ncbi:MAG: AAA family ATPase, partial [Gemmatimonadaceae bacterium]